MGREGEDPAARVLPAIEMCLFVGSRTWTIAVARAGRKQSNSAAKRVADRARREVSPRHTRRGVLSRSRVSLDLSPVHGHNQHRNAGIARRAATFPAGTTRWGDVPGCCWQVECSTSPQRTHELLVRRDASGREGERGKKKK